jgi:hypothetical protein
MYTSEFTFAYDSYPINFNSNGLQIPIHPICTGSLNRKGYTTSDMLSYFNEVLNRKLSRHEPIIFYHHPLQTGLYLFNTIFEKVIEEGLTNLTFEQYAEFWHKREKCTFEAYNMEDIVHLDNVSDNSQLFEVSFERGSSQLISSKRSSFDITYEQDIHYGLDYSSEVQDHSQGIFNKLSLLKTSVMDHRNRERL